MAGWLCLRFGLSSQGEHVDPGATLDRDEAAAPSAGPGEAPIARSEAHPLPQAPDANRSRPTPVERIHPAIAKALQDDSDLAEYHWLAQKALPTEEQRRALHQMLSDPELIANAKTELLASSTGELTREAEATRMLDVEFLADAIAWGENPEIETVQNAIEDVILAENISQDASEELAKSLAGDKMDLYTQLLHTSPERAAAIAEEARGNKVEALLAFSKEWYDGEIRAMRGDELQ